SGLPRDCGVLSDRLDDGLDQQVCRKGLVQARDAACGSGVASYGLISERAREDDRTLAAGCRQSLRQVYPRHAADKNIDHQAGGLARCRGIEKCPSRIEGFGGKSKGRQELCRRAPYSRVVIDDRNNLWLEGRCAVDGAPTTRPTRASSAL